MAEAEAAQPISIQDAVEHRAPGDVRISPDGTQVVFSLGWASKAGEHDLADLWLAAVEGGRPRRLTSGESHDSAPRWSPDGHTIAFISDREKRGTGALYVISPEGGEAARISTGEAALSDPRWSPDGTRISVKATDPETEDEKKRKDERNDAVVHGERDKLDRLCVVRLPADLFSATTLEQVEPARLLEGDWHVWEHAWSPAGDRIAVTVTKRPGFEETFAGLRAGFVPASGGELSWIGGESGTYRGAASLAWSPSGRRLAFLGAFDLKVDSGEGVYLVDPAKPATATLRFKDADGTPLSVGWRNEDTLILLRLQSIHANLWTLGADAGEPQRAIRGAVGERGQIGGFGGAHVSDMLDRDGARFACAWSDATHPADVWAGELGGEARQLTHFNDAFTTRQLGKTELVRWQADDGLEIEGQLIYPVGYEAGQRYPTILHIHGGPSWAWDDHLYANWHDWGQVLAGRGYAVLLPNPRGSTGRGWQFQIANLADWMGADYRDSQRGLDMLIERGIADPDKLGVGGWSYGGYTTAWTITQTGRFKAAIVGAGVTNRASMQGTTDIARWAQSWFQSEFAENPDEYWQHSPLRFVGQVTTPTLVLHGEQDIRVPLSQGVELYNQLRMMGVPIKMVTYPREPHGIAERHHQRDLLERVTAWFDEWVKGAGE